MNQCLAPLPHSTSEHAFQTNTIPRTLSSHALDALKDFYTERDEKTKKFEELKAAAQERLDAATEADAAAALEAKLTYPLSMSLFGEDWNESQFWVRASSGFASFCLYRGPSGLCFFDCLNGEN